MNDSPEQSSRRKGIYFLPSLFTTAGLFFGFYAIIQSTHGKFEHAAVGLFIAMIMDALDGRVARWTNTASDFGKEYDSLVDLVAFGLAPALVIYFWSLHSVGRAGWLIAFLYTAATALRLARFNTLTLKDNRFFYGLPCPTAAAFIVFWAWSFEVSGISGESLSWASAVLTLGASILMVTNIKFYSFKDFDAKNKIPFVALVLLLLGFVLIYFDPPRVLFLMTFSYVASGPVGWLLRRRKGRGEPPGFLFDDDEAEAENTTENAAQNTEEKTESDPP